MFVTLNSSINGGIIFLIALGAGGIIALSLVIFFSMRKKINTTFVENNSKRLKALEELNKNCHYFTYDDRPSLSHVYNNKSSWYKVEPINYLSYQIRENVALWMRIKNAADENKTTLAKYKQDIDTLLKNIEPMSKEECSANKRSYRYCLKIENKLFGETKLNIKTSLVVSVKLDYISPKGQVHLSKGNAFGYTEVSRIIDSVSTSFMDRETYKRIVTVERAKVTDSLRYDVLKRDGFRCVLCGMSSKDGAILHVDHIIPVSKGGKTELSNLRTLCERCNMGKSNKIE